MTTQSPRYDYTPIFKRAPIKFPGGKRLAILTYLNIEHVPFGWTGMAHAPLQMTTKYNPDIPNHGWRDYGNRVGLWRIADALDKHGFRATVNLNSDVCSEYPEIIQEGNKRGWEWAVQGSKNGEWMPEMSPDDERAYIQSNVEKVQKSTGAKPKGWLSWALSESPHTPDFLAEAGLEYVSNYTNDELPIALRVKSGSLLTMPYTVELNDAPALMRGTSARDFGEMIKDQFDVLYEDSNHLPRVMAISVHPFITGHPFRWKHFAAGLDYIAQHDDIWKATAGEVNDWYRAECVDQA